MPFSTPPDLAWRKSSYSGSDPTSNCIELATTRRTIAVRDSKHPDGPVLRIAPGGFRALLQGIQNA